MAENQYYGTGRRKAHLLVSLLSRVAVTSQSINVHWNNTLVAKLRAWSFVSR